MGWRMDAQVQTAADARVPLSFSPEQKKAYYASLAASYVKDPCEFVFDACYTEDPTPEDNTKRIALIPDKPHLRYVFIPEYESPEPVVLFPKSRRILETWTACSLDLRLALWRASTRVYIASKKQEDSDALVERCNFIYDRLPKSLPKPDKVTRKGTGQKGYITMLSFPEIRSSIVGLSENPDALRQEGATLLHIEEFAFYEWPERSYTAMLPTIQGGGKIRIISSLIAMSEFNRMVLDQTQSVQGGRH